MATNYITPNWLIPENSNQDKKSYSFDFDGTGDCVDIGNSSTLNPTGALTVSTWIKRTGAGTGSYPTIYRSSGNASGTTGYILTTYSDKIRFYIWDGGWQYAEANATIINGQWYNVIGIWNGSTVSLYIDTTLQTTTGSASSIIYDTTAAPAYIGRYEHSSGNDYFQGNIGEVAVFDYELTAGNVTSLYGDATNGVGNPMDLTTKPVGYWSADSSTFGSVFNVQNKATELFTNYSFDFDGTSDYIRTGGFTIGASFTFSCWINTNTIPANSIIISSPNYHPPSGTFPGNFILRLTNATSIVFYSYNTTADGEGISATVPTITAGGTWHHIVLTNDGVTAKFYHNGTPLTTTGVNTKTLDDLTNGLDIGDEVNNHNNPWSGYLDEIAVWNSALTAGNVTTIYNSGKPADLTSLSPVAWWRLGEQSFWDGTNWVVRDQIGSNDGTSANMATDVLTGDAPGTSGSGTSSGLAVEDRTGDLKYSESNAVSFNMAYGTRVTSVP